jgi:hypothetical protein
MANPVPDKALGNGLGNSEANSTWPTFSNTVTETSKLAKWQKSQFCVTKQYDWLIREAVDEGYEYYEALPEDIQFALVMEIIKTEKGSVFSDFDNDSLLADCIIQIMLKKGDSESFTQLYEYLQAHFIEGLGKERACFASTITSDLEKQIRDKAKNDEDIRKYGDPDERWDYLDEEVAHG